MTMKTLIKSQSVDIIEAPHPVLRQVAEPYAKEELGEAINLAEVMWKAMHENRGIGLAAPQVGVSKRLIVGCVDTQKFCLINPAVVKQSKQSTRLQEGCLSVPNQKIVVERPKQVVVKGLTLNWDTVKIKARGILAACLMHEIDHLNGITILEK